MITVINAGGSGTRLWPLSTPNYPKHLLKLTGERSLLQLAYDRALRLGGSIYIVTETSHAQHVKDQLPDLPDDNFLVEPGRRGTANCIIFALDIISRKHDKDEPIAFVHSDHQIRDTDGYAMSMKGAASSSVTSHKITLVGVEPTFPSTSFGYIHRGRSINNEETVFDIESFKEKPDFETAQKYFESGEYYWNCGYFVGSTSTFLDEINVAAPDLAANFLALSKLNEPMGEEYNSTYLGFEDLVIDYALAERSNNLAVAAAQFDWMDIGNFKDLHDTVPKDDLGNYSHGNNIHDIGLENSYIRNEEADKPMAVIGLDNVIVVNTPDGLLVARKDLVSKSGEIAKKIQKK